MRPDHAGFAGYSRPTTPNIDAFRQGATWFRRAYAPAPSTRFAMPTVFTGLDVDDMPQRRGSGLDIDFLPMPTLAQRLANAGYDTVGYTISYVVQHIRGVGKGFRVWETPWPADEWAKEEPRAATHTTDAALRYLETQSGDPQNPYLLFLHYRCTHDPYSSDPRWNFGSSLIDAYDSAAAYCDDEVGRLLRAMHERSDEGRTVVVIYSDHGELFGEHGFVRHGTSALEADVRVVLLTRIPGVTNAPTVTVPVSLADLPETVSMLAGVPGEPRAKNAWNLLPLVVGGDAAGDPVRPIYFYVDHPVGTIRYNARAVLSGPLKYVHDSTTSTFHLYDVVADPDEKLDLLEENPAEAQRLAERLASWAKGVR